jgi:hypothetical protein
VFDGWEDDLMHYNAYMRTTVELSDSIYKRLRSEAVDRGIRGFSEIVEESLVEHFAARGRRGEFAEKVHAAAGAWSDMDVAAWERERDEAWATWPALPS